MSRLQLSTANYAIVDCPAAGVQVTRSGSAYAAEYVLVGLQPFEVRVLTQDGEVICRLRACAYGSQLCLDF